MPFTPMLRSILAVTALLFAGGAQAQNFPSRPITIMVGLSPGGITDVTTRIYAEVVGRSLGQRIVVENRTGAGGGVAAAAVQNATPDGHSLLVFSGSQHATVPAVSTAAYDPVKGFAPITFLFNSVVVLAVPANSPAKTLAELHEWGKKKPGGLTFGTPGLGSPSHLLGAKIMLAANVPNQVVHYRGGAPMMADLITGRVDFGWPTLNTSRAYLADGKLRALALDADERWGPLPNTPTLVELGFAKERVASWFGIAAPASTPPAVIAKLNAEFVKASKDPDLLKKLAANGTPTATSTPEHMAKAMAQEWETIQQLVKTLNLKQK